ncbi:YciI family protein [Paraburkholderia sp. J63]|uniref:YciI family protein n=1 Tax=Paraburkholderia sp. J63 TaxID=2805434 RepID=UPI002ABE71E5|nr:YciI family protein [Paraburkholderia sp. J63]
MNKLFIVYRTDRTDGEAAAIRGATRALHRDYMSGFSARVRAGGPLLDPSGDAFGGAMIIEAESESEVWAIVRNDPFEQAALSERIEVSEFRWQTNRPADLPPL